MSNSFEEFAQNGARRENVPGLLCGASRALCAFEEFAQNAARRENVLGLPCGASRALCAFEVLAHTGPPAGSLHRRLGEAQLL
jgi:hypothetical protein